MDHAVWIGGPPAAGKTSIAVRLARRHGLRLYSADTRTWEHRDRALAAGVAAAHRWEALPPADRWRAPADELLARSLHVERGPMVLEDVSRLPRAPLVVAEGSVLAATLVDPRRAVWLMPPTAVLADRLAERGTSGPVVDLYLTIAARIEVEAAASGVPRVDPTGGVDETLAAVEEHLAAPLAAGRRAATAGERRALLRAANLDIVRQVRGFYARPWASGDPEAVSRAFHCECVDPECPLMVEATVGLVAAGPVLAH